MSKLIRNTQKKFAKMERGQVLVIVALAAVVLIAIVGLALDVGTLFIGNARLRRAVDSAALAAALQYRIDPTTELTKSATEFMLLNGITLDAAHPLTVESCEDDPPPADLCDPDVPRKLVRVSATATVRLAFLPVIGINTADISATATSEAASLDLVLVLDRSESMTNDVEVGESMRDPSYCNIHPEEGKTGNENAGGCQPFNGVQDAAVEFVQSTYLFFTYDRIAIVTFDQNAQVVMDFSNDQGDIISTIRDLTVFQGEETGADAIYPNGNPSRYYGSDVFVPDPDPADYLGMTCQQIWDDTDPNYPNPSPCTTTNIGEALRVAGNVFADKGREQALWAVVLLTDGMANAGYFNADGTPATCPRDTWPDVAQKPIYCNDADSTTRHYLPAGSAEYDADDYAYNMADFVGKPADQHGQDAFIFTVGLGDLVRGADFLQPGNKYPGEEFLKYAADVGKGVYQYARVSEDLGPIFLKIAENIATRLTH
jgi:hypothetical protein